MEIHIIQLGQKGLTPMIAASQNYFSLFFFFFDLSYVGYVPASDDLGIIRFVWQC